VCILCIHKIRGSLGTINGVCVYGIKKLYVGAGARVCNTELYIAK